MVVLSLIGETSFHCPMALTDTEMYYTKILNVLVMEHGGGRGRRGRDKGTFTTPTNIDLTLVYKIIQC